jgi:hypothetical protein
MEQRVPQVLTFRPTREGYAAWLRWVTRLGTNGNVAFNELIYRVDKATRRVLDEEASELYEQNKLDRAAWNKACIRHRNRKQAHAEPAL